MNSTIYWKKREEAQKKKNITDEKEYDKQIKQIYADVLDNVQKEIDAFYGKYAKAEGITLAEAKKRVSKLDIEQYERKAERYVREKEFSKEANEEMRLYNATMKINRLEMLKANIGLELISGHNELQKYMEGILRGRTEDELKRQAGILGETIKDNAKTANAIINASFHNAKYSDRIWMNQDILKSDLSKLLQSGLIQGKNPRVLAREIKKKFDVSTSNAERLMRTELARVQTEAQKQSFERNGFTQYTFLALGDACDVCKALDDKHFNVKDMMPGLNAPPMHPNCRCSIAAYEDSDEYEAWLEYLANGGTTKEWKSLKNKDILINNVQSSKIKSGAISGARNPYSDKAKKHAKKYYGLVRSMKTDVKKIAKTLNMNESEIQAIKDFVFNEKHDLGGEELEYFEPDYMMGESWRRLIEGKPEKHDITLIKHEEMERKLMKQGMSQEEAHNITSKKYNYDKEATEFYDKIKKYKE